MDPFIIIKNYRQTQQKLTEEVPPPPVAPPQRMALRELDSNALSMRSIMRPQPKVYVEEDKENYICMFELDGMAQMKYFPTPVNDTLIDYGDYDFNY